MDLVLHPGGTPLCHTEFSTLFPGGMLCCRQFRTTEPAACRFVSRRILVVAFSRIIRLNLRTNDRAGGQRFARREGVNREAVAVFESAIEPAPDERRWFDIIAVEVCERVLDSSLGKW